ncbi:conserved hypothetical protein [delta proteobacterium NaphS2]|nr:conserved hypothetical protein [delta proteobacterium NaphS2]
MNNPVDSTDQNANKIEQFRFRALAPHTFLGTASDRYAGWMGQIYTEERYEGRIARRTKKVGGKSFVEETLPVESVEEYFEHFAVLELDYTFYSSLLDKNGEPTRIFHVLKRYREHMKEGDRVIVKVPQIISAQKFWRGGQYIENEAYLNPEVFRAQFYEPVKKMLGPTLNGMVFEQEYQRKKDRLPIKEVAGDLERFFGSIPEDTRYHIELRTEAYLSSQIFRVLEKHGVGQVLSHWTWLPSLRKQLNRAGNRVFNWGGQRIIRLMTPMGMRYENAYSKAHPFNKLVDGMLQPHMVKEAAGFMREAVEKSTRTSIIINNRAGGNAPIIAQKVAEEYFRDPQKIQWQT